MQVWHGDNEIDQKRRWDIEYATTTINKNKRKGQERRRRPEVFDQAQHVSHARTHAMTSKVRFSVQSQNNKNNNKLKKILNNS